MRSTATYEEPRSFPEGIEWVIVAGEVVVDAARTPARRPGRVLRRGARLTGAVPSPSGDGWPGVAGIVALLGGLFFLHQTPAMTPAGGYLGGEFMYADPRGAGDVGPVRGWPDRRR